MIIPDSYHTPPATKRYLLDRILPGFLNFRLRFLVITVKARRVAVAGKYDDQEWIRSSDKMFRLMERSGGRFHITGVDNLKKIDGPVVIVSNHMSTVETMVFPGLIAPIRKVTFVVKEELVKARIFGPVMRSRNPIDVSRHNSREDLIKVLSEGQRLISEGYSIVIFPQSTRRVVFNPEEFNSLGVKLAARAGVPVIPVAIKTDFMKNGRWIKELARLDRRKPIHIRFGEPMAVRGNGKEENEQIIRFIQDHLEQWNAGN